jgi:thiol:disulfide interchange protein DsbC
VKGDGKRTLMVFSDPMCPFCKRLEQELAKLNNVSIYLWLYPIEHKFPGSTDLAKSIWCSSDKAKAWDEWMLQGKRPSAPTNCTNPVAEIDKAGTKLGINVTPTLVFADGAPINGLLPAADIDRLMTQIAK